MKNNTVSSAAEPADCVRAAQPYKQSQGEQSVYTAIVARCSNGSGKVEHGAAAAAVS